MQAISNAPQRLSRFVDNTQLPDAAISQCSQLKQLTLSEVRPTEPSMALTCAPGGYKASGQVPYLKVLDYSSSADMAKRLINVHGPKPPVASLSELRILSMLPEHQEDMALAQAILDAAQDSLEELHLVEFTYDPRYESRYFSLAGLLDFQRLSRLRHFQLRARIWHGLAKEVIRVSAGRPFRFRFEMDAIEDSETEDSWDDGSRLRAAREKLYNHVQHEMRDIKAHKNIKWIIE
ncbi:hypothetical protein BKA70DRAFT_1344017 [Coprinopsis sp. MPI-PUGE-AT-0042]|nr:hypothetical protein BKA70DRAFT_1344017 [Coprinopsis sp. MPI-PUGE-AT-0042]